MTTHITQEQAVALEAAAEIAAAEHLGDEGEYHPDHWDVVAHFLCNAAIQHYINSQPVRVPMTDEEALLKARATGGLFDDLAVNFQSDDTVAFVRAIEAHHNIKEVK